MTQVVFISKTYGSTCFRLFSSSLLCFRFSWAAKTIYLFVCLFISGSATWSSHLSSILDKLHSCHIL